MSTQRENYSPFFQYRTVSEFFETEGGFEEDAEEGEAPQPGDPDYDYGNERANPVLWREFVLEDLDDETYDDVDLNLAARQPQDCPIPHVRFVECAKDHPYI